MPGRMCVSWALAGAASSSVPSRETAIRRLIEPMRVATPSAAARRGRCAGSRGVRYPAAVSSGSAFGADAPCAATKSLPRMRTNESTAPAKATIAATSRMSLSPLVKSVR
jgi:hypothetical protein